jgi:hypothetical protein
MSSPRRGTGSLLAGAAMSGMTQAEIVDLTGYTADRVLRICIDAGITRD